MLRFGEIKGHTPLLFFYKFLQTGEVAFSNCLFQGTVTSDGINLDLYVGAIDTVVEPTRIMVCR